jgi:hypothetical protein
MPLVVGAVEDSLLPAERAEAADVHDGKGEAELVIVGDQEIIAAVLRSCYVSLAMVSNGVLPMNLSRGANCCLEHWIAADA